MRFGPCLPVLRAMALVTLEVERALGMVKGRCGRVMVFGWVVGWWESLWLRVEVLGFFFLVRSSDVFEIRRRQSAALPRPLHSCSSNDSRKK